MAVSGNIAKKGDGKRKHYRGKMVAPGGSPRAHTHGGKSQAAAGWTCGDTVMAADQTKHTPGRFKVGEPTKRAHRRGFYRSAS